MKKVIILIALFAGMILTACASKQTTPDVGPTAGAIPTSVATPAATASAAQTDKTVIPTDKPAALTDEPAAPTDKPAVPTDEPAAPTATPTSAPAEFPTEAPEPSPVLTDDRYTEQSFRFENSIVTIEVPVNPSKNDFYLVAYDAKTEKEIKCVYFESYYLYVDMLDSPRIIKGKETILLDIEDPNAYDDSYSYSHRILIFDSMLNELAAFEVKGFYTLGFEFYDEENGIFIFQNDQDDDTVELNEFDIKTGELKKLDKCILKRSGKSIPLYGLIDRTKLLYTEATQQNREDEPLRYSSESYLIDIYTGEKTGTALPHGVFDNTYNNVRIVTEYKGKRFINGAYQWTFDDPDHYDKNLPGELCICDIDGKANVKVEISDPREAFTLIPDWYNNILITCNYPWPGGDADPGEYTFRAYSMETGKLLAEGPSMQDIRINDSYFDVDPEKGILYLDDLHVWEYGTGH